MTNEPAPQGAGFFLATRGAGTFVTWVTSPITRGQARCEVYKTISKHINNALKEELTDEVVVAKFANHTVPVPV